MDQAETIKMSEIAENSVIVENTETVEETETVEKTEIANTTEIVENAEIVKNAETTDTTEIENTETIENTDTTETAETISITVKPSAENIVTSDTSIKNADEAEYNGPILRVSSLYKSFGRKQVVRGVDFSMKTGEVLGLLGPNGAGKTTTFYMVVGFYKPTNGDVFLNDKCITNLPMYKRARLGISYLPQEPSVFKKFTVEENIWSVLETRHDLSRKQKKQVLEDLIEEFSIGRIRKQKAYTLSGGERRRTEIARSLAIEPKFLLLDEPFAGIDPIAVADIKSVIKLLANRGIGVLITDHNVRDTLEITDRAIIINTGTIMLQGSKDEILASELAREIYLGKNFSM